MIKTHRIKNAGKILLLLSTILTALPCYGQRYTETGSQAVTNYSPKEYDAHTQNWTIMQDKRGIMYFGNGSGLLEFDGNNWRLYRTPNKSTIRSLAYGDDGKIYVGAQSDLGYFNSDSSGQLTFHSLMNFIPQDKRDFSNVWETYASENKIYFDTGKYLFIWHINKNEFRIIKSENEIHYTALVNGKLYVREFGKGLKVLQNDSLALIEGGEKFADERIYVILPFPGEDGTILIVTRTMGLFKYDGMDFIPFKSEADKFLKDNLIYSPGTVLPDGNILLGTLNNGAIVIDAAGREVCRYNLENGITNNTVLFSYQDHSGAIWLATDNGISRIDYTSPVSYFDSRRNFSTTPKDIIRHNGIIYTSTANGVFSLDPNSSNFQLLMNSNNPSWSFAEVGNELLVGTFDGLFKVTKDKLIPIRKTVGNEYNAYFLKQSSINQGRVYVGTTSGLWSVLKDSNKWKDEGKMIDNSDQPTSVVEDKDGRVWMGTWSSGLFRVTFQKDDRENIILKKPFIEHFGKTNGLQDGFTQVVKINEVDYFATNDSLYIFDEGKNIFYSDNSDKIISEFYKLNANAISGIIQYDKLARVWIGIKGKLAMGTLQPDGSWAWMSSPFNRFADETINKIYAEKNGITWFGTGDKIIQYDFEKKNLGYTDFETLIRKVDIGDDSTIYFGGNVDNPVNPEITFKNNSVKFRYSATSYEGKIVNKFKTFLDGFDEGWSQYSTETKKEYTNLPPGTYTFRVAALNLAGTESSTGTYSFEILPPWYRTWWAYVFYVLVLAAGIFAVDRIQRKRLIARERERAEIERKTEELEEARKLQLSMLPKEVPQIPHLDIAVYMQTATEVGGDYYDFHVAPDGTLNIAIGDATGHGLQAGTMVTLMKGFFASEAGKLELKEFMSLCTGLIKEIKLGRLLMSFSLLRIHDHRMTITSAGMPPVYLYNNEKNETEEILIQGMPLGAMSKFAYNTTERELKSGDTILLLTDGLPEQMNKNEEMFNYPRVKNCFNELAQNKPEDIIKSLTKLGNDWMDSIAQTDDITFVVIKVK